VRFGILPENTHAADVDPYETDQLYWKMFHYEPDTYETHVSRTPEPQEKIQLSSL